MVVVKRSGRVVRPVRGGGGIIPPRVRVLDVVLWDSVSREVESADGLVLERVEFFPSELLVTDGRTQYVISIRDRVLPLLEREGWYLPT